MWPFVRRSKECRVIEKPVAGENGYPPKVKLLGREFSLPRSRALRVLIGLGLVALGLLGFLPILGFWMVPLGLFVLSYEFASVRRLRRRAVVWWERRRQSKTNGRSG
jgi:hypothetical protein